MEILGRLYNDFCMPGRWGQYRDFLAAAKDAGYRFVRHQDARTVISAGAPRLLFLRHDIDSDLAIAHTMYAIEREMGICSTYYFRRCTMDVRWMREILASGNEVGYHYEEISDYIKAFGIRNREAVLPKLDALREVFLGHLKGFEAAFGAKVRTVAAHGDFSNRRIGLANTVLMNEAVRIAGGIELEAYDEWLVERVNFRAADQLYPNLWKPSDPVEAIKASAPVILLLVHPRQWQRAPFVRFRMEVCRVFQGVRYRLR